MAPCWRPRYGRRTASSTSSPTRRRTCSRRSGSSAGSTARAKRSLAEEVAEDDEVGQFIARIEQTDKAFQRQLSKKKVAAIKNFYETAVSQPPIPGTVLLFTAERLRFEPVRGFENVGHLEEPDGKYLIIDGQHRLAALQFYRNERPDDARNMPVPCIIFDGKSEDFATEMFVIINSTPTRINKSHLVDLYERVSWAAPDKKFAARVVDKLYSEGDSPLRYKINRLGGRSQQEKWILQAELFNEIHRWASSRLEVDREEGARPRGRALLRARPRLPEGGGEGLGRSLGQPQLHGDPAGHPQGDDPRLRRPGREDAEPVDGRQKRWERRLAAWGEQLRQFRSEGFYERFPAKGQVERVARVHRELARLIGVEPKRGRGEEAA